MNGLTPVSDSPFLKQNMFSESGGRVNRSTSVQHQQPLHQEVRGGLVTSQVSIFDREAQRMRSADELARVFSDPSLNKLRVCGVLLVTDNFTGPVTETKCNRCSIVLGSILISPESGSISGSSMREMITSQIDALPASFIFLSNTGWPVSQHQEPEITAENIVTDQKSILIKQTSCESHPT